MKLPFKITGQSCVGVNYKEYPFKYGNYCYLKEYYCVNMWAENIQELNKRNLILRDVEVKIFDNLCVVIDEQIPVEWRNSFCLTGSGSHTRKTYEELFQFLGRNDIDKWICGCETLEQKPSVWWGYNDGYHCSNCGRRWR